MLEYVNKTGNDHMIKIDYLYLCGLAMVQGRSELASGQGHGHSKIKMWYKTGIKRDFCIYDSNRFIGVSIADVS